MALFSPTAFFLIQWKHVHHLIRNCKGTKAGLERGHTSTLHWRRLHGFCERLWQSLPTMVWMFVTWMTRYGKAFGYISIMDLTLIVLRSRWGSCLSLPLHIYKDWLLIKQVTFVCLISGDASSCFLEKLPWPHALHTHTGRCDNSSCIRNPIPVAICLLVSVTMYCWFVLVPITNIQF